MKKGIIVEHKRSYTIVMDRQGIFHKAKPVKESEIGTEISFEIKEGGLSPFLVFRKKKNMRMAAMILLCLSLAFPLYLMTNNHQAYAIVSLDINPSVNIEIDQNYHIIGIEPMNDDAKKLLENLDLENKTLIEVSEKIIEQSQVQFDLENNAPILMAVSYLKDDSDNTLVVQELENYFTEKEYPVAIYEVSKALRTQAEKENISLNQMIAQEIDDEETIVISADNSTDEVEEKEQDLPDLNEEERELIYNFYYEPSEEQEQSSDADDSTTLENPDEHKNPNIETAEETDISMTEIQAKPSLPDQASDTAKENRIKNSSKNNAVGNEHANENASKNKDKNKDEAKESNHADKLKNNQRGNGVNKSLEPPANNHPNRTDDHH
ncbi:anti-sigma factor domain-containing protein [Gracilibacillus xinjiangensis]|uniref:RsgI N-terminal anti-sigma domain-containing protein n=1 Tax=Gracilibacillus xinjiangensis TaxID=1193282 RepID=A0ABV8WVY8_9BACI